MAEQSAQAEKLAYRMAALRELFEESGLLLARKKGAFKVRAGRFAGLLTVSLLTRRQRWQSPRAPCTSSPAATPNRSKCGPRCTR